MLTVMAGLIPCRIETQCKHPFLPERIMERSIPVEADLSPVRIDTFRAVNNEIRRIQREDAP